MTETLLARHAATDRVAYGALGERTASDLLRDAAAVAHALPERSAARPLALLGVRRDAYACCAALLGAWARGYEVLLPAEDTTRDGFLRQAQRSDVGAVLHDTASSAALPIARILASAAPDERLSDVSFVLEGALQLAPSEAQPDAPALRLVGAQLLREAALFGQSLGLPERGSYASTLLSSSRFAWAAGLFWPLLSGGALLRDDPRDPAWIEQLSGAVLVGAPAHIRMLARRAEASLRGAQQLVSLGAPLPAAAFAKLRGLSLSDVYATRELGCIGWRNAVDQPFQPCAELAQSTAARIEAILTKDGGFIANGVGAQRAEWEERIAWLDGVHDAALLPLPPEAHGYGVAFSLNEPVHDSKSIQARLSAELPALEITQWRSLLRRDERSVVPASFSSGRCDLTRNGAGRHDRISLLRLFSRDADTTPLSWELTVEREQTSPERCIRHVRIPQRYGYFAGHFPGYPLLPGAAQLSELVVPFARAVQPELGRLTRMARLKFQERIVPNDLVEVSLTFAADNAETPAKERSVEFALRRGDSVCASGRLWFERSRAAPTPTEGAP